MMKKRAGRILFLNQMAGPLFMEMAEDLSVEYKDSIIYTGHPDALKKVRDESLIVLPAPAYNRKSVFHRLISWLDYFAKALILTLKGNRGDLLFLVSNPPFLGLIGFIMNIIRNQRYVILIYDIYPDILNAVNRKGNIIINYLWNGFNKIIYSRAKMIFTISNDMAYRLADKMKSNRIEIVKCWADTALIKPLKKIENPFAQKYNIETKTVVLYSGNMGFTHNIELVIDSVPLVRNIKVHFLLIGDGARKRKVDAAALNYPQKVTALPFQSEDVLPFSIASGDIGIVSYQSGTEGCMVPSKAYYYLAAGLCLFVIGKIPNELADTVQQYNCGKIIAKADASELAENIEIVTDNPELLDEYKRNARFISEKIFSRDNTKQFIHCLRKIF